MLLTSMTAFATRRSKSSRSRPQQAVGSSPRLMRHGAPGRTHFAPNAQRALATGGQLFHLHRASRVPAVFWFSPGVGRVVFFFLSAKVLMWRICPVFHFPQSRFCLSSSFQLFHTRRATQRRAQITWRQPHVFPKKFSFLLFVAGPGVPVETSTTMQHLTVAGPS